MSKNRIVFSFFIAIAMFCTYYGCKVKKEPILEESDLKINLNWVPGLEVTSKKHVEQGLVWAFAQLGAFLPEGCVDTDMVWVDGQILAVNLGGMGFSPEANEELALILSELKSSEEYQQKGAVDMGRFLMLTVATASHYYQLVNTPETLSEFRANYRFSNKVLKLNKSAVAHGERMIYIAEASKVDEIAFIGAESRGSLADIIFEPTEFEAIDIMPNGQPRFGIYNSNGRRKQWANNKMTLAGKPSKCMWCHESRVNGLVIPDAVYADKATLSETEFTDLVERQMRWITEYRDSINTEVNYDRWREHQKMERIYEHFMEPSLSRLTTEWNLSEAEVLEKLNGIPLHKSRDFGMVYHRHEVDSLSPYQSIRVPGSAREKSSFEPNFFSN